MHDMKLTGAWAGYEFRNNTLVSPEGHAFNHDDLRWLALTVSIKHEWQRLMEGGRRKAPLGNGSVIHLSDCLHARSERMKALPSGSSACVRVAPPGRSQR